MRSWRCKFLKLNECNNARVRCLPVHVSELRGTLNHKACFREVFEAGPFCGRFVRCSDRGLAFLGRWFQKLYLPTSPLYVPQLSGCHVTTAPHHRSCPKQTAGICVPAVTAQDWSNSFGRVHSLRRVWPNTAFYH